MIVKQYLQFVPATIEAYRKSERFAMYTRIISSSVFVLLVSLCSFCQKQDTSKNIIATIDGSAITRESFNSFWEMRRLFPSYQGEFFPGERSLSTYIVAVQILSADSKAKSYAGKLKSSPSWEWQQRYFPAQLYLQKVLDANMGFSDKEIEDYYKSNREKFKEVLHITVPADTSKKNAAGKDTTKKAAAQPAPAKKDSVVYHQLTEVKDQVIRALFLAKYPAPDSLLRKKNPKDTAKIDTAEVQGRWMYSIKNDVANFFMKKFYEEKYKQKFPDSLKEWYGKGKVITPEDMNVILSWLPDAQRSMYTSPAGTADLARWLLKWKLFLEDAKRTGFASKSDIKEILDWAWKVQLVTNYVNVELAPKAKASVSVDTAMCVYAMWDERGNVTQKDTGGVNRQVTRYVNKAVYNKVDSMIYALRIKKNVEFKIAEYKDDLANNPAVLIRRADSLRDTGNTAEAAGIYRTLVTSFPFTGEGVRAYTELAKVQTEKGEYTDAVSKYRDYIILVNDKSKMCNTFFMIGFIYDEYLNKSDLAEASYKWVLKNTPDCELSDDAEFMTLHLGEPMNSVEELRAEAKRQGKKVDTTSTAVDLPVDTGMPKVKAKAKK
jgi:tetratricopeptide (TPR) repeat protein